jgi:hypothetical protein
MRLRKTRKILLIAVLIIMPVVAFFWSQGGVPSWSCLWANVQVALASPDLGCTTTCTNWSGDPCSGYSSCFNKNISCVNGIDQNGRNCAGCCFACKVVCDNPDTPPTFTQADLTCSQPGLGGWCIGTQTLNLTATESKGRDILISTDVDGNLFACIEQASPASCSIPLPEGSGGINYTALSSIGLSSSGSTSWKRDATSPTINGQVDQPQNANNWFSANINVTASASDATPGSGLLSFETSLDDATWTTYAGSLAYGEGTRTLYLRATDNAGNVEKINLPLNVDLTNPVPSRVIGGLSGSNGWYSSAITVTASATDNLSGVDFLETTTDGGTWATYASPLNLTDGTYTFRLRATDLAGNQASTASETLKVDATAPNTSVSLSGAQGSANWYTSAVSASISSTDATSGVARKSYNLNGAGWAAYSIPLTLNDGVHTLQARATDTAGHQGFSALETIYVDTTAPTLELFLDGGTSFLGWHPAEVEISASASDGGSGLSSFELSVNGGAWQAYAAPFTLSDGTHSVEARATDVAGNLVTLSKTVNVDTTLPGISLTLNGTAGNGDWFVSSVEASATASAPGSGIASFEYALAGGNWQSYTAPLSFEDGVHILYLRAENNAGKTQELTQIIKVDTTAPAIALPDAWGSDEYVYYETEDSLSGLDSLRLVVEDENERYQKAVIKKSLSGNNYDAAFLWDEKWGDGTYATPGTYYLCVKVSDVAGNQGIQCGAVTVSVEEEVEDEAPVVVVPIEPPAEATTVVEDAPPAPQQLGAPPTSPKETGFSFGSSPKEPAASLPMSETIAWGATASAAIGAFYAVIEERKRREAAARARSAAKRQKFLERMGWAKPKKMSYREIAKAYQNSINTFRARLKANGLSAYEVAKQSSNALRNGKIPDAKEIITEYKIKQAQRREAILAQKEETLKLKDPRPAYVPPDVSWKQQDYANLDHARDVAEVAKQEKPSWWENTVDWVDDHQAEISLGIGVAVGVAAVILSGGAATPLVAAAWVLVLPQLRERQPPSELLH